MQSFSAILLFHTLRGVIAELEQQSEIDPSSPALVQLKYAIAHELEHIAESRKASASSARIQGSA